MEEKKESENSESEKPSESGPKDYRGLGNQGATCYMNSLLQTLFMTPEFRKMMYDWRFEEEKMGKKEFSIPYQLQKLFARLQIGLQPYAETRDLTKSFDWDLSESFVQQDIQEFCRVLLDCIEASPGAGKLLVTQLYEGYFSNYVKCSECGYESLRQERFLDVLLPINDPFTNTRNSSLEMALENYLKPEVLNESNQYSCPECNKKVDATKGCKFEKIPQILAIQLNRFTLNFETGNRIKIMDRVTFPFVLNMNNYMLGYDGIKVKSEEYKNKLEEELKFYCPPEPEKKPELMILSENKDLPQPPASIIVPVPETQPTGSVGINSSENETNIPKPPEVIEVPIPPEGIEVPIPPEGIEVPIPPKGIEVPIPPPMDIKELQEKTEIIAGIEGVDLTEEERHNPFLWATKPKSRALLTKEELENVEFNSSAPLQKDSVEDEEKRQISLAKKLSLEQDIEEKLKQKRKKDIEEYLKQGENVYELFSVTVHNGGAYGGHYFVYIKSFEDGKWYNFNDTSVKPTTEADIIKTFGEPRTATCAYLLMYKKIGLPKIDLTSEHVPDYLKTEIKEEKIEIQKNIEYRLDMSKKLLQYQESSHFLQELNGIFCNSEYLRNFDFIFVNKFSIWGMAQNYGVTINIYFNKNVYMIPVLKDDTLLMLKMKAMEMFGVDTGPNNVRLRALNRKRGVMLEGFDPSDDEKTIKELNISAFKDYYYVKRLFAEEFIVGLPSEIVALKLYYNQDLFF